ncbi:hypothetical protein [Streptomyces avicenniae]|uniref:hypothetical protein n=1 Tax=Streptomyces avicenniae TaxID=500153 RepID=UPI00069A9562|nr:hypothetical protein [Streptomyces avicenniae]
MSRATVRAVVVGVLVAVLHLLLPLPATAGGGPLAARPSAAGTPGFCPGDSGVSVVVDFRELGGGRVVRCAPGRQEDGLSALRNAGFDVAGTARWGDSFVCRINGRPGADSEACADTPPATAYWSYWHAENGGPWRYSQRGALNRTPPQGSIEGWSFQLDMGEGQSAAPGVAPLRPDAPTTPPGDGGGDAPGAPSTPQPPRDPAPDPDPGQDAGGDPAPSGAPEEPDEPDPTPEEEPTTPRPESTASAEPTPGQDPDAGGASPTTPEETPGWAGEDTAYTDTRADDAGSSGPSPLTLAVLGLLAALGAGAAVTARRRRRAASPADDA